LRLPSEGCWSLERVTASSLPEFIHLRGTAAQEDNSHMVEARFSQLSPARQALVRVLQAVNFGELQSIPVRDADPIIEATSVVILDTKLDKDEIPRPELSLSDFTLSAEVVRLMSRLDDVKNGTIRHLEVRAGIPRRLIFELRLAEAPFRDRCDTRLAT
jgi:hypothetical protein